MAAMLYLAGLSGNASDKRYKHWIYVREVQFSVPLHPKSMADFFVTADHDSVTNVLFQRLDRGVPFHYVRMHLLDKEKAAFLKVHFDEVFVTSVQAGFYTDGPPGIYVGFQAARWQFET